MKKLIATILFSLCLLPMMASDFGNAEKMYTEEKYPAAIEIYKNAMQHEGVSASLLYNLGNACFKADSLGEAVLYYSRALRMEPGNSKIKNNLNFALSKVNNRNKAELGGKQRSVERDTPTFFENLHTIIAKNVSSNTWAWWAAAGFFLLIGAVAAYIFGKSILIRKIGFFGSIVLAVFVILFVSFSFVAARYQVSQDEAVITAYKIELLEEPSAESKAATENLNAGTVVVIVDTKEEEGEKWYKVRLNSDYVGWTKAGNITII